MAYVILRITTGEIYDIYDGSLKKNPYMFGSKEDAQAVIDQLALEKDRVFEQFGDRSNFFMAKYDRSKAEYEIIEV